MKEILLWLAPHGHGIFEKFCFGKISDAGGVGGGDLSSGDE